MGSAAVLLIIVATVMAIVGTPVYVIARRRGQRYPWIAFVPFLGIWIVLCESMGRSGWLGLLAFIPTFGALLLDVWIAVELPARHGRSRAWTLALLIPGLNLVGYWVYAFTLERDDFVYGY